MFIIMEFISIKGIRAFVKIIKMCNPNKNSIFQKKLKNLIFLNLELS